jgi:hypothetical protein
MDNVQKHDNCMSDVVMRSNNYNQTTIRVYNLVKNRHNERCTSTAARLRQIKKFNSARSQILMEVTMKSIVFWHVTPCSVTQFTGNADFCWASQWHIPGDSVFSYYILSVPVYILQHKTDITWSLLFTFRCHCNVYSATLTRSYTRKPACTSRKAQHRDYFLQFQFSNSYNLYWSKKK